MINQTVLNYRIVSLLGEGGMGTVYLGEHLTLGRKAAIKVLLPELARNQMIKDRFINEARTLSKLNHQNIVTLYDFSEAGGNLMLVMEFVEGTPLDTIIEKITGAIPEPRAVNIFKQVLEGFSYAHRQGIVHRDIKPSNIILKSDDTPKILDFGIAKILQGDVKLTQTGTRMGSVVYMSPEQVMGRDVDQRSDIYSLGVTLFEMLTGRLPYNTQTESEFDIQTKIVREPLPAVRMVKPDVSQNLENVILKATEKDVNYRFQSCEEMLNAVSQTGFNYNTQKPVYSQPQANKTVIQPPVNYPAQTVPAVRKNNKPVLIFGGAALLIIAILVIYFVTQNGETPVEKIITTGNTNEQTNTSKSKEPPVNINSNATDKNAAVETVRGFISDLGIRDFYSAYQRQNNKAWGDYDFFKSTKSFGGINQTTIDNISLNYETGDEASVYIDYTAMDPYNKNGRYKQDYILKKSGTEWKIIKVKNIDIKQW